MTVIDRLVEWTREKALEVIAREEAKGSGECVALARFDDPDHALSTGEDYAIEVVAVPHSVIGKDPTPVDAMPPLAKPAPVGMRWLVLMACGLGVGVVLVAIPRPADAARN